MRFLQIVEELQKKPENEDYLVLIRCGIFFYGIGKDAVILSEHFGLNPICITKGICKCAIPVIKIDKFLKIIVARKFSVAIYEYYSKNENKSKQYELLKRLVLCPISESRKCLNCKCCKYINRQAENIIKSKIKAIKEW